jgi:hypothetical protein
MKSTKEPKSKVTEATSEPTHVNRNEPLVFEDVDPAKLAEIISIPRYKGQLTLKLSSLEVGEGFCTPAPRGRISQAIYGFGKKSGKKFRIAQHEGKVYVVRMSDPHKNGDAKHVPVEETVETPF